MSMPTDSCAQRGKVTLNEGPQGEGAGAAYPSRWRLARRMCIVIALAFVGCGDGGKQSSTEADKRREGAPSASTSKSPSASGRAAERGSSRGERPGGTDTPRIHPGGTRGRPTLRRIRRDCARLRTRTYQQLPGRRSQDVTLRARAALPGEQALAALLSSAGRWHDSLEPLAQAHQTLLRAYVQAATLRGGVSRRRAFGTILQGLERQTREVADRVPAPECTLALPPLESGPPGVAPQ